MTCIIFGPSAAQVETDTQRAISVLQKLGWVVSVAKSFLVLAQVQTYLGYRVDSRAQKLFLPREKVEKLVAAVRRLIDNPVCSRREILRVLGLVSDCSRLGATASQRPSIFPPFLLGQKEQFPRRKFSHNSPGKIFPGVVVSPRKSGKRQTVGSVGSTEAHHGPKCLGLGSPPRKSQGTWHLGQGGSQILFQPQGT